MTKREICTTTTKKKSRKKEFNKKGILRIPYKLSGEKNYLYGFKDKIIAKLAVKSRLKQFLFGIKKVSQDMKKSEHYAVLYRK